MTTKQIPLSELAGLYAAERSLGPQSKAFFVAVVRSFEAALNRCLTVADLTADNLQRWIDARALRITTAREYRRKLRSLWRFAHSRGLAPDGPPAYVRPRTSAKEEARRNRVPRNQRLIGGPARKFPYDHTEGRLAKKLATNGPIKPTPQTPLMEYFTVVYCAMRLGIRSPRTKILYLNSLRLFDKYLERAATLADLNDDTVTAHLAWILANGRQPRTANKSRDQLLALWRYAARKRHVDLFPDVEPIPEFKRAPRAWTIEQLAKLLAVARQPGEWRSELCGVPSIIWWPALLLTLYDTGIRIGAAMQLRVDDFDASGRIVFVRAETQKHRADQVLPVSEETASILAESIAATESRDWLFPWPFDQAYLYTQFNLLLKAAGLPTGRGNKFHKIRRTSATMAELCIGPGAATIHLGHSSPKVTERYLDRTMLPSANVAAALPRPVLPTEKGKVSA